MPDLSELEERSNIVCRPAKSYWRAAFIDGAAATLITFTAMYLPLFYYRFADPVFVRDIHLWEAVIIPGIGPLMVVQAFIPLNGTPQWPGVLLCLLSVTGCWFGTLLAYQRSKWWTICAFTLVLSISSFSYFATHGLWSM